MSNPGGGHDSDQGSGERAKDVDSIAYSARDGVRHDKTMRTNSADPCNTAEALEQAGNPDAKDYNPKRKLGDH